MKKIISAGLVIVSLFALAGCGAKDINTNELASKLANEGKFAEKLSQVSEKMTEKRYAISEEDVEECVSYAGTNAVVDEVAVFKAKNADNVKSKVEDRINAQKESYKSYNPDELPKLDDCVIVTEGDCVILCVSEDSSSAKNIINEYTK